MRIPTRAATRFAVLAAGLVTAGCVALGLAVTASAAPAPRHGAPAANDGPVCRAAALSLRLVGTDTGVGTTALTVEIANHAATACSLTGYPSLGLVRGDGATLPATFVKGAGGWFAGPPARPVRLAPGGQASFFVTYRDFDPYTGRPGVAASALRVGLPGVPGHVTVSAGFAPYGAISVSPVRPGAREE
jgi:Domain of unknown function (DUF4232)